MSTRHSFRTGPSGGSSTDPPRAGPLPAELLVPYPADEMEAFPVSRKVGNTRNDGPDLIEPIAEREPTLL